MRAVDRDLCIVERDRAKSRERYGLLQVFCRARVSWVITFVSFGRGEACGVLTLALSSRVEGPFSIEGPAWLARPRRDRWFLRLCIPFDWTRFCRAVKRTSFSAD